MRRLVATLRLDVRLQARSKLYGIGVFVAVALGLMARFLVPAEHIGRGLAGFYILGIGSTTYMFGAAMLLLEKSERTLEALRVSMITSRDYVLSKTITLTGFALVESAIVFAISGRGVSASYLLLLAGVAVLGALSTLVGLGLASSYDAVTRFLLPTGAFVASLMQLPVLALIGVGPDWLWHLLPTCGPMLLMVAAFEPIEPWQWAYAASTSVAALLLAWLFCRARFRTFIRFPEA
ncbi:hypothetical protein [Haliangium sp.]|uniref:fluoroquinolone export ABC transporter permease subunit n=1 Tax=Haliangium sp. TaxID=2663208 RepID=UPI003D0B1821